MPSYVLLLNGTEDWKPEEYTEQDFEAEMALHNAFQEAVVAAGGKVTAGEALEPSSTAVRITTAGGTPVFTDGPFTELKEVVNGYYQFEAPDLETAKRLAAMVPATSSLLFPVYDLSQLG